MPRKRAARSGDGGGAMHRHGMHREGKVTVLYDDGLFEALRGAERRRLSDDGVPISRFLDRRGLEDRELVSIVLGQMLRSMHVVGVYRPVENPGNRRTGLVLIEDGKTGMLVKISARNSGFMANVGFEAFTWKGEVERGERLRIFAERVETRIGKACSEAEGAGD